MSLTLDIDGKSPGIFCKIFSPVCDAKEVPHSNFFFFFSGSSTLCIKHLKLLQPLPLRAKNGEHGGKKRETLGVCADVADRFTQTLELASV